MSHRFSAPPRWMRATVAVLLIGPLIAACGSSSSSSSSSHTASAAAHSTASDVIDLSDAWVGNLWRAEAINAWQTTANTASHQHLIASSATVVANNSLSTQASQIQTLILKHPAAIAIDSASPTALNGAIARACAAGVVVVAYDSTVTAPCAYNMANNFVDFGVIDATYVAKALHGKGNVLIVRGIPGLVIDDDIQKGFTQVLKQYPGIKVVSTVVGNSVEATAQSAVSSALPSLPRIDGVLNVGDMCAGEYNAFTAAGRPIPVMDCGTSAEELTLVKKLAAKKTPVIAVDTIPGESAGALWVAQAILSGKRVPKTISTPFSVVTTATLPRWLAVTPAGGYPNVPFTRAYTDSLISAAAAGQTPPTVPTP